ncbi:MAG: Holliday junction branch migration protein RuvA [Acidimicrobiales bacterium]|nr:Holliday junction branch migration protein RuvA [Actinomycetota bacterium]MBT5569527.1 Holliday junction branch migration protein RuvA [Acidimicrobiaceae bacterium]MBT6091688.1 Holliday junction branch migration protein RuvA [Acidimicrobiaceae bacterium]MDG2161590.1 Holliday junction branch migration protein RuvA [Acidimicrobiales bacterium]
MIGSLRGRLLERFELGEVLVEVAGVGYRVVVTPTTAVRLGEVGTEVFLHVHHHIREADQTLYGFLERAERSCFEALLSAHGVGPSLALSVLGVHGPVELARVLADNDLAALCLVPGVGKKTAARLLVELKNSLDLPIDGVASIVDGTTVGRTALSEVQEALGGLGYSPDEVRAVLVDLDGDDPAALLREALQRLARA